jgi:hypothetical protein
MPDGEESVVFVFQGPGIEGLVRDLVKAPPARLRSASGHRFSRGSRARARGVFWEARPVTVKVARIGSLLVFMVSSDTDSSPAKVRVL